jgi:hypothetical protein
MEDGSKIVKVESTEHSVNIHLQNGVVLYISSNKDTFNFHFSSVELPLNWGYYTQMLAQSSNYMECFYKTRNH